MKIIDAWYEPLYPGSCVMVARSTHTVDKNDPIILKTSNAQSDLFESPSAAQKVSGLRDFLNKRATSKKWRQ